MSLAYSRDRMSFYSNFTSPRDTQADYVQGEIDASQNIPSESDTKPAPYQQELIAQASADIARLKLEYYLEAGKSAAPLSGNKQRRLDSYMSELRNLSDLRERRLSDISAEFGDNSRIGLDQARILEDAEERHGNLHRELKRELETHFTWFRWWIFTPYLLLMLSMSMTEVVINKGVFQTILSAGLLGAWGGAAVFGIALIFFAHILGIMVRRKRRTDSRLKRGITLFFVALISLFIVSGIYQLSVLREPTLPQANEVFNQPVFNQQPQIRRNYVAEPQAERHLGLSNDALMLLVMNLGVFLAGGLLSFFRHDPHPEYENLQRAVEQARQNISRRRNHLTDQVALVEEEYSRSHENLTRKADRLQMGLEEGAASSDGGNEVFEAQRERIASVIYQRMMAYQNGNRRNRPNNVTPSIFDEISLDWVKAELGCKSKIGGE